MDRRIIVADDHPIFRQGLIRSIQEAGGFDVVAEAADGQQALELIDALKPEIAVVDISMPVMDGLALVRTAAARALKCSFIMMTMYREEEYLKESLELGVMGYLLKDSTSDDLIQCLRYVARGKRFVSPAMSDFLVSASRLLPNRTEGGAPLQDLSASERRILKLIAANKTSKEIASTLNISFRTVQAHRAHICRKLHLEGFNRLLQFAMEHKSLL
jgi:DNA-binding NarL/FixJ family response regulator